MRTEGLGFESYGDLSKDFFHKNFATKYIIPGLVRKFLSLVFSYKGESRYPMKLCRKITSDLDIQ